MSSGPNRLIAQGARPVLGVADLVEASVSSPEAGVALVGEEALIYELLSRGELAVDPLSRAAKFDIAKTSGILTVLELKGLVVSVAPGVFARKL